MIIGYNNLTDTSQYIMSKFNSLNNYANKIVKNKHDAEDIVHDSYIKFKKNFKNYIDEEHTINFMYCIISNESKNKLKFNKRHSIVDLDVVKENILAKNSDPYDLINDNTKIIMDEIKKLPNIYSDVLKFASCEYTNKEIASLLKLNESTVRTRLERGRDMLRKKLFDYDILMK